MDYKQFSCMKCKAFTYNRLCDVCDNEVRNILQDNMIHIEFKCAVCEDCAYILTKDKCIYINGDYGYGLCDKCELYVEKKPECDELGWFTKMEFNKHCIICGEFDDDFIYINNNIDVRNICSKCADNDKKYWQCNICYAIGCNKHINYKYKIYDNIILCPICIIPIADSMMRSHIFYQHNIDIAKYCIPKSETFEDEDGEEYSTLMHFPIKDCNACDGKILLNYAHHCAIPIKNKYNNVNVL